LMGNLNWFTYKNVVYEDYGSFLRRRSDNKDGSMPTTGSEFGQWDPRNITFA